MNLTKKEGEGEGGGTAGGKKDGGGRDKGKGEGRAKHSVEHRKVYMQWQSPCSGLLFCFFKLKKKHCTMTKRSYFQSCFIESQVKCFIFFTDFLFLLKNC